MCARARATRAAARGYGRFLCECHSGRVSFGTRPNSLRTVVSDDVSKTSHAVTMGNLKKNVLYYYQITTTAADGRVVTSPVKQFRTLNVRGGSGGGGGATVAAIDATTSAIYALTAPSGGDWFAGGTSRVDRLEDLAGEMVADHDAAV